MPTHATRVARQTIFSPAREKLGGGSLWCLSRVSSSAGGICLPWAVDHSFYLLHFSASLPD